MNKNRNIKIVTIIIIVLIVFITLTLLVYNFQQDFRNWVDEHILRKSITEEDISTIDLNIDKLNQVYVYSKYIALLNEQIITLYNNYGEKVTEINVGINNALFDANGKYLAIGENAGKQLCLILDKTYLWSNKIEGEILQIHVNQNGYVAVITKDTTYKSILIMYNSDGKELFRSYFSSTRIIDASISNDNKYVAIGEIDSSGVLVQSNIKIISIDNAKNDPENTIIYTYNAESGKLLTNINYNNRGQITCMYDNSIDIIKEEKDESILKIDNSQVTFMSINMNNNVVYIEEETSGVFKTNANVKIVNTQNNDISVYNIEEVPKELYTNDNIIAINVGTEVYFLNSNGWLIRKYSTRQEVTNIIFSNNLAALVYKDKIIIINL